MESAIKERERIRTIFTKRLRSLEECLKNGFDVIKVEYLFLILSEKYEQISKFNSEIFDYMHSTNEIDEEECVTELEIQEEYQHQFNKVKITLENLLGTKLDNWRNCKIVTNKGEDDDEEDLAEREVENLDEEDEEDDYVDGEGGADKCETDEKYNWKYCEVVRNEGKETEDNEEDLPQGVVADEGQSDADTVRKELSGEMDGVVHGIVLDVVMEDSVQKVASGEMDVVSHGIVDERDKERIVCVTPEGREVISNRVDTINEIAERVMLTAQSEREAKEGALVERLITEMTEREDAEVTAKARKTREVQIEANEDHDKLLADITQDEADVFELLAWNKLYSSKRLEVAKEFKRRNRERRNRHNYKRITELMEQSKMGGKARDKEILNYKYRRKTRI